MPSVAAKLSGPLVWVSIARIIAFGTIFGFVVAVATGSWPAGLGVSIGWLLLDGGLVLLMVRRRSRPQTPRPRDAVRSSRSIETMTRTPEGQSLTLWSSKARHYQSREAAPCPPGKLTLTAEMLSFVPSRAFNLLLWFFVLLPGFRRLYHIPEWHCSTDSIASFVEADNPLGPMFGQSPVMRVVLHDRDSEYFSLTDVRGAIDALESLLHRTAN
jgi:hypothetical protein